MKTVSRENRQPCLRWNIDQHRLLHCVDQPEVDQQFRVAAKVNYRQSANRAVRFYIIISTLKIGDKVLHAGKCHTIVNIKSWPDLVHGKVYALDLEARGKQVRISVAEGAELEGC